MEAFRKTAPEPAGVVLEAGRYSGTLYAYLVTKLPDDGALRNWVESYKVQVEETQEVASPWLKEQGEVPTADLPADEPAPPPGMFTRAFKGYGEPTNAAPETVRSEVAPPGAESAIPAEGEGWRIESYLKGAQTRPTGEAAASTDLFRSDFKAATVPAEQIGPVIKENIPKPGEFTSYFRGPFAGGEPSEVSAPVSPQPPAPKVVGEFTAMFGSIKNWKEERASGPSATGIDGLNESPGTFTGSFPDSDRASRPAANFEPPPAGATGTPAGESFLAPKPAAPNFPVPSFSTPNLPAPNLHVPNLPVAPTLPTPRIPVVPEGRPLADPVSPSSASGGATRLFQVPSAQPTISEPPMPSGPGAYTRIISAVRSDPAQQPANAEGQNPASASFSLPKLPTMPPPAPPPLPVFTPPPIAAPAMPKAPKLEAPKFDASKAPKEPVSYWPLILTLTVLFFVAVLLVGYFVLKH